MICIKCGNKMRLDDTDYNFKGNYDKYWICDKCKSGCTEEVRFDKTYKEFWCDEFGNDLNDYIKEKKYD